MSYVSYKNIVKLLKLSPGDSVLVSSDVKRLAFSCHTNGEAFDADLFIDSIICEIGEGGTLVFPTYNWDFCKGGRFDYEKTPSKVGALSNAALKRKDFRRTKHPIYSFAVWGKDTALLCNLDNKSSFGFNSPFLHFYENGYKNLLIDVDYRSSATFVHFCEEKIGVPYRFMKYFTSDYTDENGSTDRRTYSMYVRPVDVDVTTTINPMRDVFLENNAVSELTVNGLQYSLLDMRMAYELVELDILKNESARLAVFPKDVLENVGRRMYELASRLFPICRSITGDGVRETLRVLQKLVPQMTVYEVPSGTRAFDWIVPDEWNIKDAYIEDLDGNRIISFSNCNLHVVGYSAPVDKIVSREELLNMVYTAAHLPDAIPFVTSYYKALSGFCMSERAKQSLDKERYHIYIDSELKEGALTYGEIIIPGQTDKEIFLSTYVCHPSMANNELSGPCAAIYLAKWLLEKPRRFSYRIIFVPETIGSLTYLSRNLDVMKRNIIAGFNVSCVGDNRAYSYISSRYGNTLADRVAKNVLRFHAPDYITYSFLLRGSDERQYCAPGIDLPLCAICRSKYGHYPEYHSSADNLDLISPEGFNGAFDVYRKCIEALEGNFTYVAKHLGEPQLGRRELYPTTSQGGWYGVTKTIADFLAYADGTNDLIAISDIIGVPVELVLDTAEKLKEAELIEALPDIYSNAFPQPKPEQTQ